MVSLNAALHAPVRIEVEGQVAELGHLPVMVVAVIAIPFLGAWGREIAVRSNEILGLFTAELDPGKLMRPE